jgi:hypothetical protein
VRFLVSEVSLYNGRNQNLEDLKDLVFIKDTLGDVLGWQNQSKHSSLNPSECSEYPKLVIFTSFSEFPKLGEYSGGKGDDGE